MPKTWSWRVETPPGWEPVAEVCRRLFQDLGGLTRRVDAVVTTEIPEFDPAVCAFTSEERLRSTRRSNADFLRAVAEDRSLTDAEIEQRRMVGRAGAIRGVALQPLIGSFHVGYRQVWSELVEIAVDAGGATPVLLLNAGSRVWNHIHTTVNAISEGYEAEGARLEALETRTAEHLLDVLARGGAPDAAHVLMEELGLAREGLFRVLALAGPSGSLDDARKIASSIESRGGVARRAQQGTVSALIVQGVRRPLLEDALASADGGTAIGAGREAYGFSGLTRSLEDAHRALAVATTHGGHRFFEDDWLLALVMSSQDSVNELLDPGVRVARSHPHLAEAIRIFAGSLSMADGARALHVSHNSFRYRLMRWETLTGWKPWTLDGLVRSVVALQIEATAGGATPMEPRSTA